MRRRRDRNLFGEVVKPPRDRNREGRVQIAVVEYLRWVCPDLIVFHPANGGKRGPVEAARFKALGVLPGVPDLVLILPSRVAFWECKAPAGGRLSDDQKELIPRIKALGHSVTVIKSIEDARRELLRLGVATKEHGLGNGASA